MNDMENGNLYFSNWGVLADVNTDIEVQRGQSAVREGRGARGGHPQVARRGCHPRGQRGRRAVCHLAARGR